MSNLPFELLCLVDTYTHDHKEGFVGFWQNPPTPLVDGNLGPSFRLSSSRSLLIPLRPTLCTCSLGDLSVRRTLVTQPGDLVPRFTSDQEVWVRNPLRRGPQSYCIKSQTFLLQTSRREVGRPVHMSIISHSNVYLPRHVPPLSLYFPLHLHGFCYKVGVTLSRSLPRKTFLISLRVFLIQFNICFTVWIFLYNKIIF